MNNPMIRINTPAVSLNIPDERALFVTLGGVAAVVLGGLGTWWVHHRVRMHLVAMQAKETARLKEQHDRAAIAEAEAAVNGAYPLAEIFEIDSIKEKN